MDHSPATITPDFNSPVCFSMNFVPTFSQVSMVRRFVETFYVEILGEAEVSSVAAMATHELLENSVRHAALGECLVRVSVSPILNGHMISIRTRNRATLEDIARVKRSIDRIHGAKDTVAYYHQCMLESAERAEGSGLGLPRIRAEAKMHLRYEITGDEIEIQAQILCRAPKQGLANEALAAQASA